MDVINIRANSSDPNSEVGMISSIEVEMSEIFRIVMTHQTALTAEKLHPVEKI